MPMFQQAAKLPVSPSSRNSTRCLSNTTTHCLQPYRVFNMLCRSLFLTLLSVLPLVNAWSSSYSAFGGRACLLSTTQNAHSMQMKKGKPNVPPQMRGQYKKMQEMQEMRRQMLDATTTGDDGLPVFNLFVRTKKQNIWYPCGGFKGDERSAALAKSYAEGGMLSGISKKQLDGGIAGSLAQDVTKLKETVCRAYPQLRKSRDEFEFGYKLAFAGLPEDKAKEIVPVEPKEQKGPLDGLRNIFS